MNINLSHKRGWRYWRNLGLFVLGSAIVGLLVIQYLGMPVFLAYGHSHPKRLPVCCATPADVGLAYEDIALTTRDGLTLKGWYLPAQNRAAVLVLHPLAANRLATLAGAQMLARHGYGVLLLDLRAHGESEGTVLPFGGPEIEDVRAAVAYLLTRKDVDPARIGALGWSLGGQVSILGAARIPEIQAVVADGPGATTFADWPPPQTLSEWLYVPFDAMYYRVLPLYTGVAEPLSIKTAVAEISPRPLLLIGAGSEQRRMEYFLSAAQAPKSLWIIPEAGHIDGIHQRPETYEAKIVEFFDAALLGSDP